MALSRRPDSLPLCAEVSVFRCWYHSSRVRGKGRVTVLRNLRITMPTRTASLEYFSQNHR